MLLSGPIILMRENAKILHNHQCKSTNDEMIEVCDETNDTKEDNELVWLLTFSLPIAFVGLVSFVLSYFL